MMKKLSAILFSLALVASVALHAQDEGLVRKDPDAELIKLVALDPNLSIDTTFVRKYKNINDYSMLGIQYGISLSMPSLNPSRATELDLNPIEIGLFYTRHCKMFGYMPYFAFQIGAVYTRQSYRFAVNSNDFPVYSILDAYRAVMESVELPLITHFHIDMFKTKILADLGFFGGYRLNIKRIYHPNEGVRDEYAQYENAFHPNEKRLYYGLQFGAGIGFMLDPFELHLKVTYKWNMANLHKPNVYLGSLEENANMSKYYYTYTNLNSIAITLGIHYQLNRRTGKTRKALKEEAYNQALMTIGREVEVLDSRGQQSHEGHNHEGHNHDHEGHTH